MPASAILLPVFVMASLTVVMLLVMVATRLPAMTRAGLDAQDARDASTLKSLPANISQIADNYNHLFEQPTVFYAVALSIAACPALFLLTFPRPRYRFLAAQGAGGLSPPQLDPRLR